MSDADNLREADPWMPMVNRLDLAILGKLGEEAGELVSAKDRCLIQGIDEREPVTGKPNREWLEDEIADMFANLNIVMNHFHLDKVRISHRIGRKTAHLKSWHRKLGA